MKSAEEYAKLVRFDSLEHSCETSDAIASHNESLFQQAIDEARAEGHTVGYNDCAFKQNNAFWDKRLAEVADKARTEALEQAASMVDDKFDFVGDELVVAESIRAETNKVGVGG